MLVNPWLAAEHLTFLLVDKTVASVQLCVSDHHVRVANQGDRT